MTFLQALSNLTLALGCTIMAAFVLPRLRIKLNLTLGAGIAFFALTAVEHIDILFAQLFSSDPTALDRAWYLLGVRIAAAVALTAFLAGLFIDVDRWKKLQHTMTERDDDVD